MSLLLRPSRRAYLVLRASVPRIFHGSQRAQAVVLTKDHDFVYLLERFGPPPQVLWLTCGNTSNAHLRKILTGILPSVLELLQSGEPLVEISDPW